jgi:hypothetical protein
MKQMKYQIIELKATVSDLELQIIALEEENNDYKDTTYQLNIEMKILKCLCEQKISKIESKSGRSKESDEIKAMVKFFPFFILLFFQFIISFFVRWQ